MSKKRAKKVCPIDAAGITVIDYKDTDFLRKYLSRYNKIVPRYYTGVTLKNQSKLSRAIKKARQMALLPYVVSPK